MPFKKDHPYPFAHMTYFALADQSPKFVEDFVAYCKRYLGGHPDQRHFSLATRALEINRDVSVLDFDVAMHMIFRTKSAYDDYLKDPRHDEFITVTAGMSTGRRVFDSYIQEETNLPIKAGPAKLKRTKKAKKTR